MNARPDTTVVKPSDELVTIPSHAGTVLALFTSEGGKDIDPLLAEIRKKIDAWVAPEVKTKKGRDEIASFAFKVIRSKTALEKVGKALAAEAKLIPGKIDASRRKINSTLDEWAAEVRAPLTEWEIAEDARIKRHRGLIDSLTVLASNPPSSSREAILNRIGDVEAIMIGPACEEFENEYARAKDTALRVLKEGLAWRDEYDAEQAELAKLRAAEAEREATERAAKEAAEREARAKADAERREREVAAEAERIEARRIAAEERAAREKIEAEAAQLRRIEEERQRREREEVARQVAERDAAERRERALKEQAEAAERRAADAEARAKREAAEAAEREKAEAERREENKKHAARIHRSARAALVAGGLTEEAATLAITLIASRKVPAVSISY